MGRVLSEKLFPSPNYEEVSLPTGNSRTLSTFNFLGSASYQTIIHSDKDLAVELDPFIVNREGRKKQVKVLAGNPLSIDIPITQLKMTNSSGATATITVYFKSDYERVRGV